MLEKCEVENLRLHSTGLQTYLKLIENQINDLPFGFSYSRSSENTPLLKLIFPNLLRIGRNNSRSLNGPIKLPKDVEDLMKNVKKAYDAFYKVWNTSAIPLLMKMNSKWVDGDSEIKVGDIVYFRKQENELASEWTLGKVDQVEVSKDGIVRRVHIKYHNFGEDFPRYTDRAARSLSKLMHIDDTTWKQDMDLVERLINEQINEDISDEVEDLNLPGHGANLNDVEDEILHINAVSSSASYSMSAQRNRLGAVSNNDGIQRSRLNAHGGYDIPNRRIAVQYNTNALSARDRFSPCCSDCCCWAHCKITTHVKKNTPIGYVDVDPGSNNEFSLLDRSWDSFEDYQDEMYDSSWMARERDQFMARISAVNVNLKDDLAT